MSVTRAANPTLTMQETTSPILLPKLDQLPVVLGGRIPAQHCLGRIPSVSYQYLSVFSSHSFVVCREYDGLLQRCLPHWFHSWTICQDEATASISRDLHLKSVEVGPSSESWVLGIASIFGYCVQLSSIRYKFCLVFLLCETIRLSINVNDFFCFE